MNIQTERLDNHIARLTVEVEDKQWNKAKHNAARKLSKQYRIPGFRKGKAPYNVVVRYLGEAPIVENAIENLGQEIYKDVLEKADINPYTSGSIEDFQLEPQPTYVFTVPLQPEVDLGEYREVRLDFETVEVTDEEVDEEMEQIRQHNALVEESSAGVVSGNRVTIDIHSEFADEAPESEIAEAGETESSEEEVSASSESSEGDTESTDEEENAIPQKGDNFIHRHDAVLNLDPQREPILPGFIEALVGAEVGEEREFELDVPEDDDDYKDIGGRKVRFLVTVKKIEVVTLSELNDDFAARVSEDYIDDESEEETLTLLQLRMKVREQLQKEANSRAEDEYSNKVLDAIVEGATVQYPEAMLNDQIHDMIHDFDMQLQQQGVNLETYQKVLGITHEDLHDQYRDDAAKSLKRSLVLGEVLTNEDIRIKDADVKAEIDKMLAQFGEQAEIFRQYFDTPQQRSSIANNILYGRIMERLGKIGRGEPIEVEEEAVEEIEASAETTNQETKSTESTEETVIEGDDSPEAESTEETVAEVTESDESESDNDEEVE